MEARFAAKPVQGVIENGSRGWRRDVNRFARDARGYPGTSCTRHVKHRNHGLAMLCGGAQKFFNLMFIKDKKSLFALS